MRPDAPVPHHDVDVVVVGAGPTGLTLALCLARRGVRAAVVERRPGPSDHPRAHYVNTRTMELFAQWGVADAVLAHAYPSDHLPFEMLVAAGAPSRAERARLSPASVASCAQDRVEEALLDRLATVGGEPVRWARTLEGFDDHGDRVVARLRGPDGPEVLTGRWLVGADGAGSAVRRALGVDVVGDPDLGSLINIYFDGRITPEGEVPPLATGSSDPEAEGSFISMDGDRRWCFHHWYDPAVERPADFDPERCADLVRRAAGLAGDHPIRVRSIRPWRMTAVVAERMRQGSVFLAGDAAHAFPPTGGIGMNSGIQDAHNLAWKLAAVLSGVGGPGLLDSYEDERLPVAYLNTAQSLRNSRDVRPGGGESPYAALIEERASRSVRSVADAAVDRDEQDRLRLLEHGAALGQEIGFAYDRSRVVVADGRPRPDVRMAHYVPNAAPGARAPHLLLRDERGRTASVLDLFDDAFVLLTGGPGAGWRAAAAALPDAHALRTVVVGPDGSHDPVGADFGELYGVTARGAVLVRPDGHVAFRSADLPEDPAAVLAATWRVVRGLA